MFYECLEVCFKTRLSRDRCRWLRRGLVSTRFHRRRFASKHVYWFLCRRTEKGPEMRRQAFEGRKGRSHRRPDARFL